MTPKEKALEIYNKIDNAICWHIDYGDTDNASKDCALIAVDEIIESESAMFDEIYINTDKGDYKSKSHRYAFWLSVKQEIQNL
jgi:hypothetical protein